MPCVCVKAVKKVQNYRTLGGMLACLVETGKQLETTVRSGYGKLKLKTESARR